MPISHIHSYLVHPRKKTSGSAFGGTTLPTSGKLFELLREIYDTAESQCDIDISFNQSKDGKQSNDCRDLVIEYAFGPTLIRGRHIAGRLEQVTTRRSGLGLLFLIAGVEGNARKLVISRFPTDSAILAEEDKQDLNIEFLERVFMKSATAYKAVIYKDTSRTAGFWKGKAVDRQINDRVSQTSNYWVVDFLASDFLITSAAGTRRFAIALRNTIRDTSDLSIKAEIAAAATLAKALKGKRASANEFCDLLNLSEETKILLRKQLQEVMDEKFQFDLAEFSDHLAYRSVELNNGGMLTAEASRFDEVFDREQVNRKDGTIRFSTEGKIVSERLGKSKLERLGK